MVSNIQKHLPLSSSPVSVQTQEDTDQWSLIKVFHWIPSPARKDIGNRKSQILWIPWKRLAIFLDTCMHIYVFHLLYIYLHIFLRPIKQEAAIWRSMKTKRWLPFRRQDSFHFSPSIHKCNQDGNGDSISLLSSGSLMYILPKRTKQDDEWMNTRKKKEEGNSDYYYYLQDK